MILLAAVALAIIVGVVRGGKIVHLAECGFRYGWLALIALGLQLIIVYVHLPSEQGLIRIALLLISYALLLLVVVVNRRQPGLVLIGIGLLLNLAAMLANQGWMPVSPEALEHAGLSHLVHSVESGARVLGSKDVVLSHAEAHLWMLGDVFVVPSPIKTVFSIGDVLLALGAFLFFQGAMQRAQPAMESA